MPHHSEQAIEAPPLWPTTSAGSCTERPQQAGRVAACCDMLMAAEPGTFALRDMPRRS